MDRQRMQKRFCPYFQYKHTNPVRIADVKEFYGMPYPPSCADIVTDFQEDMSHFIHTTQKRMVPYIPLIISIQNAFL